MSEEASFIDPVDGTRWRVDLDFLRSNWRCLWGAGCKGILPEPTTDRQHGCCSLGAELFDEDEAMLVAALAATLEPARFEQHVTAATDGVFADDSHTFTRVVDNVCIFHNSIDFPGGAGCALHLGAIDAGESPVDWKPGVCWQLPLRIERVGQDASLRRWGRSAWGTTGTTMAWCCTEAPDAYTGDAPVIESLSDEIEAMVGPEVAVQIRRRLADER